MNTRRGTVTFHLLWAEDPQTLCGRDLGFLALTEDPDHHLLCLSCKRVLKAGKRQYIDDLSGE